MKRPTGYDPIKLIAYINDIEAKQKELIEKSMALLHLHSCEQEGMLSGMPTNEDWLMATQDLQDVLNRIKFSR